MASGLFSDTVRDVIAAAGLILAILQICMAVAASRHGSRNTEASRANVPVTARAVPRLRSLVADEQLRRSLLFAVTTAIVLVVTALLYAASANLARIKSILEFKRPLLSGWEALLPFVTLIVPTFQGIGFAGLLHVSEDETNADRVFWQRTFTAASACYTIICVAIFTITESAGLQLFAVMQIYALLWAIVFLIIIWGVPKVMSWIDS